MSHPPGVAARGDLDDRIAATDRTHGLDRYDPDDLCDQVDAAADELRRLRAVERAEARRAGADVLVLQQTFDGMVTGWFRLNVLSAAVLVNALTHWTALLAKGSVTPPETGGTPAVPDSDDPDTWTGRDRGRQQATALVALAAAALSGLLTPDGARRPAKPLYVLHVDVRQAHPTATLELDLAGRLPSLTARLVELLGSDATIQAVLFDGHRPLAVSSKLHADHLPADTRLAVQARDLGNRDPGPCLPVGRAHVHHLVHRADGGDHDVDNLACLGPAWHLDTCTPETATAGRAAWTRPPGSSAGPAATSASSGCRAVPRSRHPATCRARAVPHLQRAATRRRPPTMPAFRKATHPCPSDRRRIHRATAGPVCRCTAAHAPARAASYVATGTDRC